MAKCEVAFLPMTASGHMIPMVDMAVLMASRGVKTTIITTTISAHRFFKAVEQTTNYDHQITLYTFQPKADDPSDFLTIISEYKQPVEQFLEESRPNCIIADVFYTWSTKVAAKFNIPRIIFDPSGIFSKCVIPMIRLHEPEKTVSSDSEPFIVPNLPGGIMFTKKQIPDTYELAEKSEFVKKLVSDAEEAEATSYGTIVNTFYEVEPEYACHYRKVLKKRLWNIGPVSLFCNNTLERGGKSVIDEQDCCKWLDLKTPNSVVYINFGSVLTIASSQVYEIAMALEACDHDFIWVVKKDEETSIPPGFEERMRGKGKGLIIKGWAPQVLILEHVSVGGFMTHAGWNSILESICGVVGMVTWPVSSDQFYNAKLVTDVLKTGVPVGDVEWKKDQIVEGVKREAIQKALERIMSPKEGGEIRKRVQVLKDKAKAAVEEGGSSFSDLTAFIEEMKAIKSENKDN